MLRMGDLAPATEQGIPAPSPASNSLAVPPVPKARTGRRTPARVAGKPQRSFEDLLIEARAATAQWSEAGLNAEAIRAEVRCSAANARRLRDALKAERAQAPALHVVP